MLSLTLPVHTRVCEYVRGHACMRASLSFVFVPRDFAIRPDSYLGNLAMDSRTEKRMAQIAHIRQKQYYSRVLEEPDPFREMSTRMWKYTVKMWIRALKQTFTKAEGQPRHHEGVPPAVMGGC
jgi:hypothetical protein